MASQNEYISDAAETMLQSSQDAKIRTYCEAVEEARRRRRGLEIRLEQAQAQLQEKEAALQAKDSELQAKDEEIARLKALLEKKNK